MPLRAVVRKESARRLDLKRFEKAVLRILKKLGFKNAEVGILLTTDLKIRITNKRFLGHDYATDVISFGASGFQSFRGGAEKSRFKNRISPRPARRNDSARTPVFLGDLILSLDTAVRECEEYGNSFSYEVLFYTVHGILHCMGHEDDTPQKSAQMLRKQALILKQAGLDRYSLVR